MPEKQFFKQEYGDFVKKTEIFHEYFPDGEIYQSEAKEIPAEAMEFFEKESLQLILPEEYKPRNFENFFVIKHKNGDKTYAAEQTKTYHNGDTERLSYFLDARNSKSIGHGELRWSLSNKSGFFKDKPFVGFTETEKEYQRQGLAERRLYMLNAFSKMTYGFALYSSDVVDSRAINLWEKLVNEGKAKKFKSGEYDRYVFL